MSSVSSFSPSESDATGWIDWRGEADPSVKSTSTIDDVGEDGRLVGTEGTGPMAASQKGFRNSSGAERQVSRMVNTSEHNTSVARLGNLRKRDKRATKS